MIAHVSDPKSRTLELPVPVADNNPSFRDRDRERLRGKVRCEPDGRHGRRLGSKWCDVDEPLPGFIGNLRQPFLCPGGHCLVPGPSSLDAPGGDGLQLELERVEKL